MKTGTPPIPGDQTRNRAVLRSAGFVHRSGKPGNAAQSRSRSPVRHDYIITYQT